MEFSERVEAIFEENKITRVDFNKLTGYSKNNLSKILGGHTDHPRMDFLIAIAKVIPNLNFNWLFFEKGERYLTDDEEIKELKDKSQLISSLQDYINYLTKENQQLREEIEALKKLVGGKV